MSANVALISKTSVNPPNLALAGVSITKRATTNPGPNQGDLSYHFFFVLKDSLGSATTIGPNFPCP